MQAIDRTGSECPLRQDCSNTLEPGRWWWVARRLRRCQPNLQPQKQSKSPTLPTTPRLGSRGCEWAGKRGSGACHTLQSRPRGTMEKLRHSCSCPGRNVGPSRQRRWQTLRGLKRPFAIRTTQFPIIPRPVCTKQLHIRPGTSDGLQPRGAGRWCLQSAA